MISNIQAKKQDLTIFIFLLVLLFCIYVWIYLVTPFEGIGNDLILNLIYLVFAFYPALILWRIVQFFERQEPSRKIWLYFFAGFCLFLMGEVIWTVWNITEGEVPSPSSADIFYIGAYIFLGLGLLNQYFLIFRAQARFKALINLGIWGVAIAAAAAITFLKSGMLRADEFTEFLYPGLDLALAVIAFYLVRTFGKGSLARPLWGFLAMFVADLVYALLVQTGNYNFLISGSDLMRLVSDITYNLAYIVFAFGFWGHYATLKYGDDEVDPVR